MTTEKARTPGRPRSFDPDAALLRAEALFAARGYDAVGVADLTSALGINPPSLYAAFGNKAALFERVVERYAATTGAFCPEALDGAASLEAGLDRLFSRALDAYLADGTGCLVLEGARGCSDPAALASCALRRDQTRERIRSFIADHAPRHAAPGADMAVMVLSSLSSGARSGLDRTTLAGFARLSATALARHLDTTG